MTVATFLRTATNKCVVQRAVVMAIVVGTILILINHGRCLIAGSFNTECLLTSLATVIVPYCVSTVSSVLACQSHQQ